MPKRSRMLCAPALLLPVCWLISCATSVGVGPGGAFVSFEIGGKTITFSFGDVGRIAVQAGQTTRVPTSAGSVFDQRPTDSPPSASLRLPSDSVGTFRRADAKSIVRGQALPLWGSATIRFLIAPGSSADPCADGILLAEYDISLTTGVTAVLNELYEIDSAALAIVLTNDVSFCIEVTADFDGDFTIGDVEIIFGGGTSTGEFLLVNADTVENIHILLPDEDFDPSNRLTPGSQRNVTLTGLDIGDTVNVRAGRNATVLDSTDCPTVTGDNYQATVEWDGFSVSCVATQDDDGGVTPGTLIQVPVYNDAGFSTVAPVTATYGGVDYGVVGVLYDQTPEVDFFTTVPNSMSVDLSDLGLQTVDMIYMGGHSSFAGDLPNGVDMGTLQIDYAEGGSPTILDFVLGVNTAEWAHERPELAPVPHDQVPTLYTFPTTSESGFEYLGREYAFTVTPDSSRTISCITLTIAPGSTYAAFRDPGVFAATWASQYVAAMTFEGPAGTPSLIGDCSGATTPVDDDGTGFCDDETDCAADEICTPDGICIPGDFGTNGISGEDCSDNDDCAPGETCVAGTCVAGPDEEGFIPATIVHRGSEQVIAGPNVDPAVGTVIPAGYGVGGDQRIALSGDDSKVWFSLYDQFPEVGDPQNQLWSVNLDGSGGQRSIVPGEDSGYGLSVETNYDGSVCYADYRSAGKMFRATPGAGATEAFDYVTGGYGDIRGQFKISDDATKMVYVSFVDSRFRSVDLTASPNTPVEMAGSTSLVYLGVNSRYLYANIDLAADGSRWISSAEHYNPDWDPGNRYVPWVGDGLGAGATMTVHADFTNLESRGKMNITDDGSTMAYVLQPEGTGVNDPNECIVEAVDGSWRTSVGDGRTTVTGLVLADDGSRAYYATDGCCSGGTGIFEDVATGEKLAAGTQAFLVDQDNACLSDDGNTLVSSSYSAAQPGIYVLRDGSDPPSGFPSIEGISHKFMTTGEDCSLFVRVTASSPRGIEIIFVNPYFDGVDPTESVPGPENPLFSIRSGSFAFTPVEGLENVWDYEIRLTNDVGECVSNLLTSDYRLRVVVKDINGTMTVFQDFAPAQ